jgi:hypothetical protein
MGEPARGSSVSLLLLVGDRVASMASKGTPPRTWYFVRHLHEVVPKFRGVLGHADALAAAALRRFEHDGVAYSFSSGDAFLLGSDHGLPK